MAVGWHTINPSREALHRVVENGSKWVIAECTQGKKRLFLTRFPELSAKEEKIVSHVKRRAQESGKKGSSSAKVEEGLLKEHCIGNLVALEKKQKQYLLHVIRSCVNGFGALDDILCNKSLEEVALIGTGHRKPVQVFHKEHGWLETNLVFDSQSAVSDMVNRMARSAGKRLTMQTPSINAVLADGNRLHAAISPVSFSGPCFTIRKFSRDYFTPLQLVKNNTISAEAAAFLWMALLGNCSIMVAGNTGSGKTSTLNALFCFVPEKERIVVVEETPEIMLPHRHLVKLNVVQEQGISMQKLIIDTLRMRPDRVVVGEVRSSLEIKAFVDTLLAGQGKGSYCTFHSQSAEEALKRVASMGVLETDLATIDLIVVQRRWDVMEKGKSREERQVTEISELVQKHGQVKLNTLYRLDFGKNRLERIGESQRAFGKMQRFFSTGKKGIEREIKRRAGVLETLSGKGISLEEFFRRINSPQNKKKL